MNRRKRRVWRTSVALGLAAFIMLTVPASSWGYWSASTEPISAPLGTGLVNPPAVVSCTPSGILVFRQANVSWTEAPDATYNVIISNADGSISEQTSVSDNYIALTGGVLNNLLGGLVSALFGSGNAIVSVQTVHASGWVSENSAATIAIGRSGLLIDGLLGGVECK